MTTEPWPLTAPETWMVGEAFGITTKRPVKPDREVNATRYEHGHVFAGVAELLARRWFALVRVDRESGPVVRDGARRPPRRDTPTLEEIKRDPDPLRVLLDVYDAL